MNFELILFACILPLFLFDLVDVDAQYVENKTKLTEKDENYQKNESVHGWDLLNWHAMVIELSVAGAMALILSFFFYRRQERQRKRIDDIIIDEEKHNKRHRDLMWENVRSIYMVLASMKNWIL